MDLIRPRMDMGSLDDGIQLLNEFQGPRWGRRYKQFDCPANGQTAAGGGHFDYGYNMNCPGRNHNTVKADMIVVHDANTYAPDPASGRTANPGIHNDGFDNYLFSDGHVEPSNGLYKKAATEPPWLSLY
jgi:prepilin-type processing-associated H-X9-DG protein